jgi:hypothetical protein
MKIACILAAAGDDGNWIVRGVIKKRLRYLEIEVARKHSASRSQAIPAPGGTKPLWRAWIMSSALGCSRIRLKWKTRSDARRGKNQELYCAGFTLLAGLY